MKSEVLGGSSGLLGLSEIFCVSRYLGLGNEIGTVSGPSKQIKNVMG